MSQQCVHFVRISGQALEVAKQPLPTAFDEYCFIIKIITDAYFVNAVIQEAGKRKRLAGIGRYALRPKDSRHDAKLNQQYQQQCDNPPVHRASPLA